MGLNFLNNADVEGNTTLKGFLKWGQSSGGQVQYMYRGDDNFFAQQSSNTNTLYSGTSYFQIKNSGDNGVLFTVENTGDVGIGTTNPSRKLQVIGTDGVAKFYYNSSFTNSQYSVMDIGMMTSGTAADGFGPKITFRMGENGFDGFTSATIGTKRSGADNTHDLTFATSNAGSISNKMVIAADGDVGIGTDDPSTQLDVIGGNDYQTLNIGKSLTDNSTKRAGITFTHYDTDEQDVAMINSYIDSGISYVSIGGSAAAFNSVEVVRFYTASNTTTLSGTERMRIANNGNVGIGTTDPDYKLEVTGGNGIFVSENNAQPVLSADSATGIFKIGDADELGDGVYATNTGTSSFDIYSAGSLKFRMNSNGDVGINDTNPSQKLEVGGNILATQKLFAAGGQIGVKTTDVTSNFGSLAVVKLKSTGNNEIILDHTDGGVGSDLGLYSWERNTDHLAHIRAAHETSTTDAFISFHCQPNGGSFSNASSNEKMRISSSGYVGIGTTAPSSLLHMANGSGLTFKMERTGASASTYTIANASDRITHNYVGGSAGYVFAVEGTNKMTIAENGNVVISGTTESTNFILSSDSRLKKNIKEVDNKSIKADWKTFELKTEKGQKRYGVIAQELEKTNPEFVRENTQGFKSVAYIDLLIAKIAELEVRIQKLEK